MKLTFTNKKTEIIDVVTNIKTKPVKLITNVIETNQTNQTNENKTSEIKTNGEKSFSINNIIHHESKSEEQILKETLELEQNKKKREEYLAKEKERVKEEQRVQKEQNEQNVNNEQLKLIFPNSGIISYDLFDTLIFRYCKDPPLIFDMIQEKVGDTEYKQRRQHAESIAYSSFNKNIDDIYRIMQDEYHYSDETIAEYKHAEIETEIANIFPNNELFLKIKENDIIVSDMYLREEHLRRIIKKCVEFNKKPAFNPDTIKIYVSSDGKHNGWIWETIKEQITYHIGDNQHSDYEIAKKYVPCIHYRGTPYSHTENYLVQSGNTPLANLVRYVRLLNPYDNESTEWLIYQLQTTINIPILLLTCRYLHDLDKKIMFHLRDSYYIKILYDILYPDNNSELFFTSRYIYYHANEEYIQYYNSLVDENTILFDLHGSGTSYTHFTKNPVNFPDTKLYFLFNFISGDVWKNNKFCSICGIDKTLAQIELLNISHLNSTIELKNGIFYKNKCEFDIEYTDIILNTILTTCRKLTLLDINMTDVSYIYNHNNLFNFESNTNGINLHNYFVLKEHKKEECIPTSDVKMHLVSFHTCGPPYDYGYDLKDEGKIFENLYVPFMESVTIYNTKKCLEDNPFFLHHYLTYYPPEAFPKYCKGEHSRGNRHGFWKWKPYIIKQKLEKIDMGDVLIYHDCNISRYSYFVKNVHQLRENVQFIMEKTGLEIIVPIEHPDLLCKHHVKRNVFKTVGENNDDYRNFPLLNANRIFIKKTNMSIEFVNKWLDLCSQDLILPEEHAEPDLRWNTHDQAILSVLYKKYINIGLLRSPGFYIKDKNFSRENIIFI
jgi:hypothetical protein